MKGWLKLLVLVTVPVLAVTMVAAQNNEDKGSQLIFQSNMAHKSFISVANAHDDRAVTLLVQYYNDEMEMVLWYLRLLPPNGNALVDAFDHTIPGSDPATNVGDFIMGTDKVNSGHFVIAVTAVAADSPGDPDATPAIDPNTNAQANILFPTFLAEGMDNVGNIDEGGTTYSLDGMGIDRTPPPDDGDDETTKNVGDLNVDNAQPVSFNHLTGHFTEALISTDAGGSDQTASWGGTPVVRAASGTSITGDTVDYVKLAGDATGALSEKAAGGSGVTDGVVTPATRPTYAAPSTIMPDSAITNRGINGGALVLPALHGGGGETKQIMLILSVADNYGDPGEYSLLAAKTGIMVSLMDGTGGILADPSAADGPVFGGAEDPETPPGTKIIVEGIQVMTDAGDCGGDAITGPWTLDHLTSIVPAANTGTKDFAGLMDEDMDPMVNASPGWIKFKRTGLSCKVDYGDGDSATGSTIEDNDGVPTTDERTYAAGTLVVEEANATRNFVTVGRALLKFITTESTFAASWTLKSPVAASP